MVVASVEPGDVGLRGTGEFLLFLGVEHLDVHVGLHGGGERFKEGSDGRECGFVAEDDVPVGVDLGEVRAGGLAADDGGFACLSGGCPC